jgi:hypothetical protein
MRISLRDMIGIPDPEGEAGMAFYERNVAGDGA